MAVSMLCKQNSNYVTFIIAMIYLTIQVPTEAFYASSVIVNSHDHETRNMCFLFFRTPLSVSDSYCKMTNTLLIFLLNLENFLFRISCIMFKMLYTVKNLNVRRNQLLQLCTARTAWSKSYQAVRTVYLQ